MVELELEDDISQVPDVTKRVHNGRPEFCRQDDLAQHSLQKESELCLEDCSHVKPTLARSVHKHFQKIQKLIQRQDDLTLFPSLPVIGNMDSVGMSERDSAISSIKSIHVFYGFGADTFAAAVHYLDRFLGKVKVKSRYLSCIAAAAYYLAVKMNEESQEIPSATELASLHRFTWKSSDLKRMEKILLEKLGWDLFPPVTCLHFLRHIYNLLNSILPSIGEDFFTTVISRSEMYVNHSRCAFFRPATLAISVIRQCLKEASMCGDACSFILLHVQSVCQITDSELFDCQCAISQQLDLYNLHPATSPVCLPLPKPATRPNLVSRPSFYGNTDLPTIEEIPHSTTMSGTDSSDSSSGDEAQLELDCAPFRKVQLFGDKFDLVYGHLKCNMTKS